MSEERDQPVADDTTRVDSVEGVADEADAQGDDQPEGAEEGEADGQAEDDTEEIEHEGVKARLPKALAKEFREGTLRQADYTRKTQEVAQTRQELEARSAEIAQQAETHKATLEQRVQLATVDNALAQYEALDWSTYRATYGDGAAIEAQAQWQQLRGMRERLAGEITAKEQEHVRNSEQATANAIREAEQVLSREVQGYGPDLVQKVVTLAHGLGMSGQELRDSFVGADGKADTRTFRVLAELADLRAFKAATEAKQKKAQTAEKQASVTPAKTVSANAGQYKPGLNDDLPIDEWRRRRNAEIAKQRAR